MDIKELSKITTRYSNRLDEMKVNKNDYSVDFSQEINDIQKSLNDTIRKLKDLGKKLDTKATSVFPNYPKMRYTEESQTLLTDKFMLMEQKNLKLNQ